MDVLASFEGFQSTRLRVSDWGLELSEPSLRIGLKAELEALLIPSVLEFLPPSLALPVGENAIGRWIAEREELAHVFTVRNREDSKFLGLLFLFQKDAASEINIGYMLAQSTWGQGVASELVKHLLVTLSVSKPLELVGGVATGNPASARVLLKNGFHLQHDQSTTDLEIFKRTL